ncbi:MAG: TIGR02466 family protein [Pseudomonadota bacterium]
MSETPNESTQGFAPEVWFQTPVWSRKVVDYDRINNDIMATLQKLEAETESITRSNVGGWHSHDQIHRRKDMAEIRRIIGQSCVGCATFMEFDFDNFELVIKEMWLNKNGPGDFNKAHIHPNAILSGAYYVRVPDGAGNIEFYDPVPARLMNVYPVKKQKRINAQAAAYKAAEGLLLIFPSWLQHAVQPNRADAARVSISFNVSFRPKTKAATASAT